MGISHLTLSLDCYSLVNLSCVFLFKSPIHKLRIESQKRAIVNAIAVTSYCAFTPKDIPMCHDLFCYPNIIEHSDYEMYPLKVCSDIIVSWNSGRIRSLEQPVFTGEISPNSEITKSENLKIWKKKVNFEVFGHQKWGKKGLKSLDPYIRYSCSHKHRKMIIYFTARFG